MRMSEHRPPNKGKRTKKKKKEINWNTWKQMGEQLDRFRKERDIMGKSERKANVGRQTEKAKERQM